MECLSILKEKEEKKRRDLEEKEKRKKERWMKKKQKEEDQKRKEEEKVRKATEREEKRRRMEDEKIRRAAERETLKAKKFAARAKRTANIAASATSDESHAAGNAQESISSDASTRPVRKKRRLNVDSEIYTDLCCVCFGSFKEDEGTGREWLKCDCGKVDT